VTQRHDYESFEKEGIGIDDGSPSPRGQCRLEQFVNEQEEVEQEGLRLYHGWCW